MSIAEKLTTVAENVQKVYEAGEQKQYDLLWDAIQRKGTRTIYDSAFIGSSWNDEVFKPKYDIRPATAKNMFRAMKVTNLKASLESAGVVLDTSACTDFETTFYYGTYGHIPEIDTRSAANLYTIFCGADAHTIDKWILKDDGSQKFNQNTFTHNSLKNLVVEGVIGQNQLSFANCTNLTHDSLLSILNALKDYSVYTGSTTWKITLGSKNIAKLTDEDKEIASSKGWVIA